MIHTTSQGTTVDVQPATDGAALLIGLPVIGEIRVPLTRDQLRTLIGDCVQVWGDLGERAKQHASKEANDA
ncbi:hypothetical protein [Nocardia sp. CC227C]|uniref:hypothetical protein n=1 Tax=Nocardia sp. CC227C TaxID=3044562 RepID=UPI00278BE3DA|nr:hypothetical protein [Nocardia sp. CC227C]